MTVAPPDARRILEALIEERRRLHPADDAALLKANAIAVAYWRELLARAEQVTPGSARASARGRVRRTR